METKGRERTQGCEKQKFQQRVVGMDKKGLSVVLMVALLATSFLELHARVDLITALTAGVGGGEDEPCCNECTCPPIYPYKCLCTYVKQGSCPAACADHCTCEGFTSASLKCTCAVNKDDCTNICKTTGIEK